MRPVFYDYPEAAQAPCDQSMTFTLGSALLIAPPPKMESPQRYDVCLPKGGWYDYWTGKPVGGSPISETPSLERLPVFVRAGTILPRQPLVQSTSETPVGPLTLDIYPGPDCAGSLYLDDGHSIAFQKGAYLRQAVRCSVGEGGNLTVTFEPREGRFAPWWRKIAVIVHDRPEASRVTSPTMRIEMSARPAAEALEFEIPDPRTGGTISIGS